LNDQNGRYAGLRHSATGARAALGAIAAPADEPTRQRQRTGRGDERWGKQDGFGGEGQHSHATAGRQRRAVREHRSWSKARTAAAIIATAALAPLAAACGASPTSTRSAGSPNPGTSPNYQALAFARCMRSDGLSNWPDPESNGAFDKTKLTPQQLGASTSHIQAVGKACQHLFPAFASGMTPAQFAQMKAQALRFSRCIRAHGVPNYPDPGSDGREPDPASIGINDSTPTFQAALKACPPT
jgi:hypothetical protein